MSDKEREVRLELAYEQLDKVYNDFKHWGDKEQAEQLKEVMKRLMRFIVEFEQEIIRRKEE